MPQRNLLETLPAPLVALIGAACIGAAALVGGKAISEALAPSPMEIASSPESKPAPTSIDRASSASQDESTIGASNIAPEAAVTIANDATAPIEANDYMVVAAHPAAAQAGAAMIKKGGGAIDAAIAAQMVLNLVEPQSSGIGGGGFMLHWNAPKRRLDTYDGRETAPMEMEADAFLTPSGDSASFWDAVAGGRSVGVPGLLRMLEMAHQQHGKLPWNTLFEPAITLAEDGFPVSPRLHGLIESARGLAESPSAAAYFFQDDGSPKPVGSILTNPEFAETLRVVAESGADAFYTGAIALDIAEAVQTAYRNQGWMQPSDLSDYQAIHRPNLCQPYRDHLVCGMPPPSSGGSTVLQALALLESVELEKLDPYAPEAMRAVGEASALAFADRNQYLADSDFVSVPLAGLFASDYLKERTLAMDLTNSEKLPKRAGAPNGAEKRALGDALELPSTTHLSIVDKDGSAVSLTSSIETGFGSRLMVRGFLLNNQLTDFSWRSEQNGKLVANRIEPGKRPRSSMAPTLVFDEDRELQLITGSPGGSRIIGYTLQSILNVIDWDMNAQEAANAPRYLHRNTGRFELEESAGADAAAPALEAMGYTVTQRGMVSGLHIIEIDGDALEGGVDPRREGAAIGEEQQSDDLSAAFQFISAQ